MRHQQRAPPHAASVAHWFLKAGGNTGLARSRAQLPRAVRAVAPRHPLHRGCAIAAAHSAALPLTRRAHRSVCARHLDTMLAAHSKGLRQQQALHACLSPGHVTPGPVVRSGRAGLAWGPASGAPAPVVQRLAQKNDARRALLVPAASGNGASTSSSVWSARSHTPGPLIGTRTRLVASQRRLCDAAMQPAPAGGRIAGRARLAPPARAHGGADCYHATPTPHAPRQPLPPHPRRPRPPDPGRAQAPTTWRMW
jgi:hypothetical protein